jgi:hypothetical protein
MPPRFTKDQYREMLERNRLNFAAVGKECGFSTQRARQVAEHLGLRVDKVITDTEPTAKRPLPDPRESRKGPKRRPWS